MTRIGTPTLPAGDTLSELFASLDDGSLTRHAPTTTCEAPVTTDEQGRFTSAQAALSFMMGGNATVTLVSKKTGSRFTYRIRASDDARVHFVGLLNGADNESSYAYIGYIRRGVYIEGGVKARVRPDAPSAAGFKWAFAMLTRNVMPPSLEVWHEGRCGRCARKLTVPSSIASGFGPECAGKVF